MRIFLLGFMGTGKTHWGKRWAKIHALPFYDLDSLIEDSENLSVAEIFEKKGEEYFRVKEAETLRSMNNYDPAIISCGGGTPCYHENMDWINQNGISIYFDAPPSYILQNVKKEQATRPLLNTTNESELLFFIEHTLKQRTQFYSRAKMILDARQLTDNSFETIINTINW
jgi:shikimate kinase